MCYHLGLVVPFVEHRYHSFKVILKGPRIFGMINEQWLQLKLPAASVSQVLEPDTLFYLAMKVLVGIFFQYKAVLSILKMCCLV